MTFKISHKCKAVGQYRYGGIGSAANYLREIKISAVAPNGEEIASISAFIMKIHELLEEQETLEPLVTMMNSTREFSKLCVEIYGFEPLDLAEVDFTKGSEAYSGKMKTTLDQFKLGQFMAQQSSMDLLLITEARGIHEANLAEVGIKVLRGMHKYFKDVEYVFISPRVTSPSLSEDFEKSDAEIIDAHEKLKGECVESWRRFGFKPIVGGSYMFAVADKLYFFE